jgi:D-alanyl-lipoteichoic acid acyltransferase DltB (MBOAT superfamily)
MVPLGVSFFTFQGLTYLFSRRNKELTQAWSLPEVVAFVAFFPTVFSGPIMRATSWEQQMARDPRANRSPRTFSRAMSWMCLGLFYKLVLSTLLGETVDAAWSEPSEQNPLSLWLAVYGYAFQLYTDFCGYSYLAASVALLLGFEVPQNFNRPYAALSVQDFWRRWHMSLSSWLRDYLYIGTLKGNARGKAHQVGNVIITFLLCGAWHGFALHYLIWGAWQAVGVAFSTVTKLAKLPSIATRSTVARIAGWFVTFQFIAFGWVWFRAPDTPTAWAYLLALFNTGGSWQAEHGIVLVTLTVAALCHAGEARLAASGDGMDSRRWPQSLQLALWTLALLAILAAAPAGLPPFIYFKY